MEYTPEEKKELRAVEYLKSQLDLSNSDAVLAVYRQILEQDVFHTEVGLSFLRELNDIIHQDETEPPKQVPPVPDPPKTEDVKQISEGVQDESAKKIKSKKNNTKQKQKNKFSFKRTVPEKNEIKKPVPILGLSIFLNVVLAIMVVIMFVLTITSDSPNIINYKSQLEDEYAAWDEELNRREQELKKREAELNKLNETTTVDDQVEDTADELSQESTL